MNTSFFARRNLCHAIIEKFAVTALSLSLVHCSNSKKAGADPLLEPCSGEGTEVAIAVSSSPDMGIISPHKLVRQGTTVHLNGITGRFAINNKCRIVQLPLAFAWKLTSIPEGNNPSDVSSSLVNPSSLSPSFIASDAGMYIATLQCTQPGLTSFKDQVIIEVIKPDEAWIQIGASGAVPGSETSYSFTGRCNTLYLNAKNSNLYAGAGLGGLWKYSDENNVWYPLSDNKGLPSLGTSAINIASDGTIYVATGDLHPGTTGFVQSGRGIFMSADNGLTWEAAGQTITGCGAGATTFSGNATKIITDPFNAGTVFIASDLGVYRSTNRGNCWVNLYSGNRVTDMVVDPQNAADILFVVPNIGVLSLANAASATPSVSTIFTFPKSSLWALIKTSVSTPGIIYVSSANSKTSGVLYKSTDGGTTWPLQYNLPCKQCDYNMALAVDPADADHLLYGEVSPHQSIDGGVTFSGLAADGSSHSDYHDIAFDPNDRTLAYGATDGGIHRIRMDATNSYAPFTSWQNVNNGLAISQVATLAIAPGDPFVCSAGLWDNGTQVRTSGRNWVQFNGGDGFNTAIDALSPKTIFYNANAGINGDSRRSPGGFALGDMANFVANPYKFGELFGIILTSKSDAKLYVAKNSYASNITPWGCADPLPGDKSPIWSLEFAPGNKYYATYQTGKIVKFTLDGSRLNFSSCAINQTAAIQTEEVFSSATPGLPNVAYDPFDNNGIYSSIRLNNGTFSIGRHSKSTGVWTHTDLNGNLPGMNVKLSGAIDADPLLKDHLYLGDQHGLWSGMPGASGQYVWKKDMGIPDTWVTSIITHRNPSSTTPVVRLSTFGRGIWERIPFIFKHACANCVLLVEKKFPDMGEEMMMGDTGASSQIMTANKFLWLTVQYDYSGHSKNTRMLARPLIKGSSYDQFVSDTPLIESGEGSVIIPVHYLGKSKGVGFTTDSIWIRMIDSSNNIIYSKNFSLPHTWLKKDETLLRIASRAGEPGASEKNIKVSVKIKCKRAKEYITPADIAVPKNVRVKVTAPMIIKENGVNMFRAWQVNLRDSVKTKSLKLKTNTSFTLTATYKENE